MKSKKLFTTYGKHSDIVTYEYRGKQYDVEYAKDWTFCTTPARIQHQDAQRRIDKEIELENRPHDQKPIDLDEIFEILGWD